jgi:curved DNA-binding protein CbpA
VHAYRQQVRAVHPDTSPAGPEASARFRALTRAYEVLSDPSRRDAYDQRRAAAAPPAPPAPGPRWRRSAWPPGPGAQLWAGPVHIRPSADPRRPSPPPSRRPAGETAGGTPGESAGERAALLAYLISRYFADEDWMR